MPGPQGVTSQVCTPTAGRGCDGGADRTRDRRCAACSRRNPNRRRHPGTRRTGTERRGGFLRSSRAHRTGLPTLRPPRLLTWGTVAVDEAWTTPPSAVTHSDGVERDGRGRSRTRCPGPIHGRRLESQDPWWVGGGQRAGLTRTHAVTASGNTPPNRNIALFVSTERLQNSRATSTRLPLHSQVQASRDKRLHLAECC